MSANPLPDSPEAIAYMLFEKILQHESYNYDGFKVQTKEEILACYSQCLAATSNKKVTFGWSDDDLPESSKAILERYLEQKTS